MEGGSQYREPQRGSLFVDSVDATTDEVLNQSAQAAAGRLKAICEERTELLQYAPMDNIRRAQLAIKGLRVTLLKYPHLIDQLRKATKVQPDLVVMAVLPEENLVLLQTGEGFEGFAPVLTCTHLAIDDLSAEIKRNDSYGIVTSVNGLIPTVLSKIENDDRTALSYIRGQMNPADYVALGAQGLFYNETFRFRLDKQGGVVTK